MFSQRAQIITAGLFLLAILYVPHSIAAPDAIRESWGTSRIHGKVDNIRYDFRVISVPFTELPNERKSQKSWKGVDSHRSPEFAIITITFKISDTLIKFPLSAFRDLGEPGGPYGMSVESHGKQILLNLKGGDGGGSYTAIFIIENSKLIERSIKEFTSDGDYKITETIKL